MSEKILDILCNKANTIYVSQISLLEIAIKQKIKKLTEFDISISSLENLIKEDDFLILPIQNKHIACYDEIPLLQDHKDPLDRLILATALSEGMSIISADHNFKFYADKIILIEV